MDPPVAHLLFIVVHATFAVLGLVATVAALRFPRAAGAQAVFILVMTAALAGAEVTGFATYPAPLRIVFPGLLLLAGYMCVRAIEAWRARPMGPHPDRAAYVAALGFDTISLTFGFLAIAALRLGLGPFAVAAAVVVPIAFGRLVIVRAVRAIG